MKSKTLILAGLIALVCSCSRQEYNPDLVSSIDSLMSVSFKANTPGAVILVAKNGVPVFRKAYGLANLELNVPNKPEYAFAIASMTKQFTAVCVLQLVQQGKLSLHDDIRKYIPELNTHGRAVTIEHLLTHTNGLSNLSMKPGFEKIEITEPSEEEMLALAGKEPLLFEPGSDWSYNDIGFTLAAIIVERVSGSPFNEFLEKNIFQPLQMTSTTVATRERTIPMLATGYSWAGDTLFRPAEYISWKWCFGMGDIVTTVDDMLKWDEALYTDKLLNSALLKKAWTPFVLTDGRPSRYGYGWWISEYEGLKIIYHGGGTSGFRSYCLRIPSEHLYVVILSNNAATGAVGSLGIQIALKIAGKPLDIPPVRRLPPEELQPYTGVYKVAYFGIVVPGNITRDEILAYVTLDDSVLNVSLSGGSKFPMHNVGTDLFAVKRANITYLEFKRGAPGNIDSLKVYSAPTQAVPTSVVPKTKRPLPKEKIAIKLNATILRQYAGKYNFGGDRFVRVRVEGERVFINAFGEIFPENETRFFSKRRDITIDFKKNSKGSVDGMTWASPGRYEARKVE